MIQTNADEVADTIPKRFKNLREEFEEERDRALSDAKELARSRVPVDKGDLRTDISIDLRADKLYNTLDYAPRINWGFTGRDTLGRYYDQEGTYYLEDSALDAFIESVERLRR